MPDVLTADGTLAGIEEKPTGWTSIKVALPGKEHPLKLDTKIGELVELARAAGTNMMTWKYSEQDSGTPNPHRPGSNYINRRFEGVEPVGSVATPAAAPSASRNGGSDGMTPEKWDAKERRDYRSRAWAQTLAAFTHTIRTDESPEDVFNRLQPFQRKVYVDVTGMFAYPEGEDDLPF